MTLFSPRWLAAREEIALRAVELNEAKRAAKKECADKKRHLKGDVYVVPDYLEQSAGKQFRQCRRCKEWIAR